MVKLLAGEVKKSDGDISSTSEVMQTVSFPPPKAANSYFFQVLNRKDTGHIPSAVDGEGVVKVPLISLHIILIKTAIRVFSDQALLQLLKYYSNRHSKYPTAEGFEEMFERVKTVMVSHKIGHSGSLPGM